MPGTKRRLAGLSKDGESRLEVARGALERVTALPVEEAVELHALMTDTLLRHQSTRVRVPLLHGSARQLNPVLHLHDGDLERLSGLHGREAVNLAQQQGGRLLRRQVAQRADETDGQVFSRDGRQLG